MSNSGLAARSSGAGDRPLVSAADAIGAAAWPLGATASLAVILDYGGGSASRVALLSGVALLGCAVLALIACLIGLRFLASEIKALDGQPLNAKIDLDWRDFAPWYLIAASLGCFVVAQIAFLGDQGLWQRLAAGAPTPNATILVPESASAWWWAQYPLLWAGLLMVSWPDSSLPSLSAARSRENQSRLTRLVIDRLLVVLAALLLFWKLLLETRFIGSESAPVAKALVMFYPLADVGHLFCGLMLISATRRRLSSRTLALLLLSLAALLFTDAVYAFEVVHDSYVNGEPLDSGWIAAWLLLGAGALDHARHQKTRLRRLTKHQGKAPAREHSSEDTGTEAQALPADAPDALIAVDEARERRLLRGLQSTLSDWRRRWMPSGRSMPLGRILPSRFLRPSAGWRRAAMIWLPYVFSIVVCAALIGIEWQAGNESLRRIFPVLGLIMAVVARQLMTLSDNIELSERLREVNSDLERNVDERTRHLATLHGITSALNSSLDTHTILQGALEKTLSAVGADSGGIWLRKAVIVEEFDAQSTLESSANADEVEYEDDASGEVQHQEWATAYVSGFGDDRALQSAVRDYAIYAALTERAPKRDTLRLSAAAARLPDAKGLLLLPVRWQGLLLGALGFLRREGEFSYADRALVESVALEAGTALENARLYQEASRRADRDGITELFNHRAMQQQLHATLAHSREAQTPFSVVMMDLNNFKFFNDTYGHLVGDDVLRLVSRSLQTACRSTDVLGRYGGDEFIAILPATDAEEAREACARFADRMDQQHFESEGAKIPISMSFGWAVYPEDGETPLELTTRADTQLYENKRGGGSHLLPNFQTSMANLVARSETRRLKDRALGGSFGVLDALVTAIDNKDHYTRRHSEEVTYLALLVADELAYEAEMMRAVRIAGLLHDVGKIAVPDAILRHPGKLGADQTTIMQQHPIFGALIVKDVAHQEAVIGGVRHHHERFDGKGYPDHLSGEAIPWMGRLLAVPDCYSAMTTDRPYRKALAPEQALDEIERGAGVQFDPLFAVTFVRVMRREIERVAETEANHSRTRRVQSVG